MENYDQSIEINHNRYWPYIPDHPYRILITGVSGSGRPGIDKIYLYVKDAFKSKCQLVINGK